MSKVVTMIPVRMASTRLPNKPLLDVNGKSILQRVYENVKACVPGDIIIAAGDQILVDEAGTLRVYDRYSNDYSPAAFAEMLFCSLFAKFRETVSCSARNRERNAFG